MCKTQQPCAFLTLTIVMAVSIFVLTLLNMIFSIVSPKKDAFIEVSSLINYDIKTSKNFLSGIDFNETFIGQNTGFGQTGRIESNCYAGYCEIDSNKVYDVNCSDTCLYSKAYSTKGYCYIDGKQCQTYCSSGSSYGDVSKCATYNKIDNWKGYQSKFVYTNYTFLLLNDTVTYNEECHTGYKQCGILNKEHDKFCVRTYEECPINKIVVKDSQNPPTDFKYTEVKLGNKYIYYTNENVDNFLYTFFFSDSDINNYYEEYYENADLIDTDTIYNFLQNNPFLYNAQYSKKSEEQLSQMGSAYLKVVRDKNTDSLEELRNKQDLYNRHKALYSNKTLEEMNSGIITKNNVLMGFSIGAFAYFCLTCFFFITFYAGENDCGARTSNECNCCTRMSPCKNTTLFYCVYLPTVILVFLSFIFVCDHMVVFNTYSNQEYIEEYYTYYYDFFGRTKYSIFEENKFYNSAQFVCLLLAIIFMIIHPILIFLIYGFSHPVKYVEAPRKKIRSAEINTVRYQAPPTYIPPPPVYYQPPPPPHHHHHHPPPPPHGPAIGINFNSPLGSFGAGFGINLPHGFI